MSSNGRTAIVAGATGITGRALIYRLHTSGWITHALTTRIRTEINPPSVHFHAVDLLNSSPEEIAQKLKEEKVRGEYVFFAAYIANSDPQKECDINGKLLSNFLDALRISGLDRGIKRIILSTGSKYYGVHLGPFLFPAHEEDPRIEGSPNFYYVQEDILRDYGSKAAWDWVVSRPNGIQGTAKGNFMNLVVSLGLYAAITKELDEPFVFPGCQEFYFLLDDHAYAPLIAEFQEFVALKPEAGNQAFNTVNGDMATWCRLWPKFANRWGLKIPEDQFVGPARLSSHTYLAEVPPIMQSASSIGIDTSPRGVKSNRVSLVKWAAQEKVEAAWRRLVEREGLDKNAFEHATWQFADFTIGRNYNVALSMTKARKLGWTGYKDTWEAYEDVFSELEKQKYLPRVRKVV